MRDQTAGTVRGVDIAAVADAYDRRGLDRLSDHELVNQVAEVVASPRNQPADSFVLHAPLELVARSRLLPLVAPTARRRARLHLVALASAYEATGPPLDDPDHADHDPGGEPTAGGGTAPAPPDAPGDAVGRLVASVDAGDLDATDRAARALASRPGDLTALVRRLATALTSRTAAAGHASIFLQYLATAGWAAPTLLPLLRPLARELARHPTWRIRWIDGLDDGRTGPSLEPTSYSLAERLASAPRPGPPGSTFIHPLMMQVDESGMAADLLGPVLTGTRASPIELERQILRTAALSMILDTAEHAPYGWTHTLTLAQAVLALRSNLDRPDRALAIAATQVLAFRAALGDVDLDPAATDDEAALADVAPDDVPPARIAALATAAATSHDAHIVKYALAVIDAARVDPAAAGLYVRAGERLLEVWDERGGDPTDPLGPAGRGR